MGILEYVYSAEFRQKAFDRLQLVRATEEKPAQRLTIGIDAPQTIEDDVVKNFLIANYTFMLDVDADGDLIMADSGGVIANNIDGLVIALDQTGIQKLSRSTDIIREAKQRNLSDMNALLAVVKSETPISNRGDITILDGTRNVLHFDFLTYSAVQDLAHLLTLNPYLVLKADGFTVETQRHLVNDFYAFNLPLNRPLADRFQAIAGWGSKPTELKEHSGLVPHDYLFGFHIRYDGNHVSVAPIIPISQKTGNETTESHLRYIGMSFQNGHLINIMQP